MKKINFYLVDVFATHKYEGNQLAVFLDLADQLLDQDMQQMAREINFAETTFIKAIGEDLRCVVRIFTPEHEVPFAGHPSLGTSYVIAKFMLPEVPPALTLALAHGDIPISIPEPHQLNESTLYMRQAQPEFRDTFTPEEISEGLSIPLTDLETSLPIQEISTGLPYILIPLKNRTAMETLSLTYDSFKAFLLARNRYRTNTPTCHSTSLFFFTKDTYEPANTYNARMMLLQNDQLSEDAATGSANGCLLAYLLRHKSETIKATVEQGFQMGRKSYIYLDGQRVNETYELNVGGRVKLIAEGVWTV